jgi:hypothetical protein
MKTIYKGSVLNKIADERTEADKLGKLIDYIELTHSERHQFIHELRLDVIINREVLEEFVETGKCVWNGITIHYNGWAG